MTKFVRFILVLVVVGAAVSLGMVTISNARSRQAHDALLAKERALVAEVMGQMKGKLRRAHIVVNGQEVDAERNVVRTRLLVREFTYKQEPLPVREVVIPGSKVSVDGVHLIFGENYPEAYREMRGTNLWLLMRVYAECQSEDERFSFWRGWDSSGFTVPVAMRVRPAGPDAYVSHFERRLWQQVWYLMRASAETQQKNDFAVLTAEKSSSLRASAEMRLQDSRHSGFYEVSIGLEGVTISEVANVRDRTAMREEWKGRAAEKRKKSN